MALPEGHGSDAECRRIRAALIAIAGARGYPDTTIDMVLDRAAVSQSAFRSHFADLEDCFREAWQSQAAELQRLLVSAAERGGKWRERMRAATGAAASFLAADDARVRFLILEADRIAATRALRDGYLDRAAAAIDSVRAELVGSPSPATAELIVGSLYDLVSARLRGGGVEDPRSLAGELRYMLVMPYWGLRAAEEELAGEDP